MPTKVSATLTMADACAMNWDFVVLGAGPAGSAAARMLASAGKTVLLLDRNCFPRPKVCGCCLNGVVAQALEQCGMPDVLKDIYAQPLHEMHLHVGRLNGRIPLSGSCVASREKLDEAMLSKAIESGTAFLPATIVQSTQSSANVRSVRVRCGNQRGTLRAKMVLACTGLNSSFLDSGDCAEVSIAPGSRMGLGAIVDLSNPDFCCNHTVLMARARSGYVGIVRLEDGRLNIAAALDAGTLREEGHPGAAVNRVLSNAGLPQLPNANSLLWRGTPLLSRKRARVAAPRLLIVGDAAGYAEPFTGEGIAWAVTSGFLSAQIAAQLDCLPASVLEEMWVDSHRKHIQRRQRMCNLVSKVLRSNVLSTAAMSLLRAAPSLAKPLLTHLNSPIVRAAT